MGATKEKTDLMRNLKVIRKVSLCWHQLEPGRALRIRRLLLALFAINRNDEIVILIISFL